YKDSCLAKVLPILVGDGSSPGNDDKDRTETFRPQLTPVGQLHPIFRFSPDETDNQAIWNKLPGMYWYAEGFKLQPAAEVLAVHPGRNSTTATVSEPIIIQQFVGSGRCLLLGINETWRWGFREDLLRFNQFWIQTVKYLARSGLGRIELRLDRQTPYRRGEP